MKTKNTQKIPYSILELATVAEGDTPAETFPKCLEIAQKAEEAGYYRFWLSEHHNTISVASSATSVLVGYIAGGTKTMRVGSGGVMLPNHSTLAVAEQFGTLESMYPGRIDLGLGRAPGTDQVTALALNRDFFQNSQEFPLRVQELQTYFSAENGSATVRALPGEGLDIPIWILGSSTDSAKLAAMMGLPYAFATHFAPAQFESAINLYRKNFRPSSILSAPKVLSCVNMVAADTDEEAHLLATSLFQMFMGIITGKRNRLQPPLENITAQWGSREKELLGRMLAISFIGSPATIHKEMKSFLEQTGVEEIMVISNIYDHQAKIHSYELFGEVMKEING